MEVEVKSGIPDEGQISWPRNSTLVELFEIVILSSKNLDQDLSFKRSNIFVAKLEDGF